MYTFSSIDKEHIIFSNSMTDRSVFLHQIECCKIQFTSIKLNLVLSKQKLIVDMYSSIRPNQKSTIEICIRISYFTDFMHLSDHPNYQNIQNMALPPILQLSDKGIQWRLAYNQVDENERSISCFVTRSRAYQTI